MRKIAAMMAAFALALMMPVSANAEPGPDGEPHLFMNPRAFEADGFTVHAGGFASNEEVTIEVDGSGRGTTTASAEGQVTFDLAGFPVTAGSVITVEVIGAAHRDTVLIGIEEPFISTQWTYTASSLHAVGIPVNVRAVDRDATGELFIAGQRIGPLDSSDYRLISGWIPLRLDPGTYEILVVLGDGQRLTADFTVVPDTFSVMVTPNPVAQDRLAEGITVTASGLRAPDAAPGVSSIIVTVRDAGGRTLEALPAEQWAPVEADGTASLRLADSIVQQLQVGQTYTVYVGGSTGAMEFSPAVGEISSAQFTVVEAAPSPAPPADLPVATTPTLPAVGAVVDPGALVLAAALTAAGGYGLRRMSVHRS